MALEFTIPTQAQREVVFHPARKAVNFTSITVRLSRRYGNCLNGQKRR